MQITLDEYKKAVGPQNKYFAKRTERDGFWFDSKKEADRYSELKILERCGQIKHLCLQPPFPLTVNEIRIGFYVADFSYYDVRTDKNVIEDVKSKPTKTQVYRLKKKLFEALYGRKILET